MTKTLPILHELPCGGDPPSIPERLSAFKKNCLYTSGASTPISPSIK